MVKKFVFVYKQTLSGSLTIALSWYYGRTLNIIIQTLISAVFISAVDVVAWNLISCDHEDLKWQ